MLTLKKENFKALLPSLQAIDLNTLFARSVLEGRVGGTVFADDAVSPRAFYIRHPYGMAFLYDDTGSADFFRQLKPYLLNTNRVRDKIEWLQGVPDTLATSLDALLGDRLIKVNPNAPYPALLHEQSGYVLESQRINYLFCRDKYLTYKHSRPAHTHSVVKTSREVFCTLNDGVVPKFFWNSYDDFNQFGGGFTLMLDNHIPASTAFASFVLDNKLEIGIETAKDYHGMGYGALTCSALIDFCLAAGLEPVWSCNSTNIGSRKLAEKLGFVEYKRIPYYRLPV